MSFCGEIVSLPTSLELISAEGSFRITSEDFTESLHNQESDEYKSKEDKYSTMVISVMSVK